MKPLILMVAVLMGWNATALANPIKSTDNVTDVSYVARTTDLFTEPTFQRKGLNECLWNGRSYKDEEVIDITEMPCRVCYCKTGDVRCSNVSCYEREDCEGLKIPGTCCPKYDHCPPIGSTEPKTNYGAAENTFSVGQSPDKREFFSWKSDGSEKTQARDERSSSDENALTIVMKRVKNGTGPTSDRYEATDSTVYPAVNERQPNENVRWQHDAGNATVRPVGNFDFYGDEENAVRSPVPSAVAGSGDRPAVYGGIARTVGNLMLIADELEESLDEAASSANDTKSPAEEGERHEIYGRKGSGGNSDEQEQEPEEAAEEAAEVAAAQARKSASAGSTRTDHQNVPPVEPDETGDRNKPVDASELKLDEPEVLPLLASGPRLNALDADEVIAASTSGANKADVSSTATDYELLKSDATVTENYSSSSQPQNGTASGTAKRFKPVAADVAFDRSVKLRKYKKKLMSGSTSSPATSLANYQSAFTEFDQIDPTPHEAATVADGRADVEHDKGIWREIYRTYNGALPTVGNVVRFLRPSANESGSSVEIELNDANKTRLRVPIDALTNRTADRLDERVAAAEPDISLSIKTIDFIEDNSVAIVDPENRTGGQREPNEIFEATGIGYKVNEDYQPVTGNPLLAENRFADTDDSRVTAGTTLSDDRQRDELFQATSTGVYRINDIYTVAFNDDDGGAGAGGMNVEFVSQTAPNLTTEPDPRGDYKREIGRRSDDERAVDPAVPYPEEYPEEYQTIQNGPSIIITKTTYTSVPDVTYTTVTMATLPTFQQIEEAENALIDSITDGAQAKQRLADDASPPFATKTTSDYYRSDSTADDLSTATESAGTANAAASRLNGTAEAETRTTTTPATTVDAKARAKKSGSDGREVKPATDATKPSAQGNVEATTTAIAALGEMSKRSESDEQYLAGTAELDDADLKIIRNFVNKNLRLL